MSRSLLSTCVAAALSLASHADARADDRAGVVARPPKGITGLRHEVFAGASTSSLRHAYGGRVDDTMGYAAPRVGYGLWGEGRTFAVGGLLALERGALSGGLPLWRADLGGAAMLVEGRLRVGVGVAASTIVFARARRASGVAATVGGASAFASIGVDVIQWQDGGALALSLRPDLAVYGAGISAHRVALTASVRF